MNHTVLFALPGTGAASGEPRYFPDLALDTGADLHELLVKWYSTNLRAMAEPSLFAASEDRSAHSYRFLWLRTFHRPIAVRLNVKPAGDGVLTVTVLDGAGGYRPGSVENQRNVELDSDKVSSFLTGLDALDYWTLQGPDPTTCGCDGAQWVLEGVRDGKYHVVHRWSPSGGAFGDACLLLVRFSQTQVDDVY